MPDGCAHLAALERMHAYLYPEHHGEGFLYWSAGTIEGVASILNDALGCDGEGRNPEQSARHALLMHADRQRRG